MGSCCSRSVVTKEIREEITSKFDRFDFRITPDDQLTFLERAKRELAGGCAPIDYLNLIYS